ncbi:universal stress protein [Haloglomus salinum]|jgi:nucleotide-binding universal stress UspA family protein|uniref:universal stress protein n=1 Tax=Haloglomus salinum TaxID=2962673 RepID=UPI0020C9CBBE|nr:universal stress protein [Haloglomus salinum]
MVDHVLVPMDDSPLARQALDFALDVHPAADITVLHVVDYVEESYGAEMLVGPDELRERALDRADQLVDEARERAADHEGDLRTATEFGDPARKIVQYAADEAVDLVVMGGHGRPLVSRILLGDVAQRVVQRAECPVTVVR